jgi:hypothetical protein
MPVVGLLIEAAPNDSTQKQMVQRGEPLPHLFVYRESPMTMATAKPAAHL